MATKNGKTLTKKITKHNLTKKEGKKQSFAQHILELRLRVIYILFIYLISFSLSYYFNDIIYELIARPIMSANGNPQAEFIYTNLTEAFFAKLSLSAKIGFIIAIPFISFHIYKFISPGLYKKEQKIILIALCSSNILFYLGIIFVYYLVMPKAFEFFLSFQQSSNGYTLMLHAKISEYISLVTHLAISFGIAFQLPVVLFIFVYLGILSPQQLIINRRVAIVLIFILAGIITPPDVASQLLLALPLIGLYELTIRVITQTTDKM
ncbi:MAG: twin-arginine translocase subunit TatC [Rickettsiaceae bacterium]|nr:twin-arginine translocase subunit TatC [Rickettsiaceae bacterium]